MNITPFSVKLDDQGRVYRGDFPELPKYGIYIITKGDKVLEVLRVGESGSGKERLLKGFSDPCRRKIRGKDRKNYIAYDWRVRYPDQSLKIDFFELKESCFQKNHFRRALEAEVTFQFRLAKKHWPKEMSEIHFLEQCRECQLLIENATAVLDHYGIRYNN